MRRWIYDHGTIAEHFGRSAKKFFNCGICFLLTTFKAIWLVENRRCLEVCKGWNTGALSVIAAALTFGAELDLRRVLEVMWDKSSVSIAFTAITPEQHLWPQSIVPGQRFLLYPDLPTSLPVKPTNFVTAGSKPRDRVSKLARHGFTQVWRRKSFILKSAIWAWFGRQKRSTNMCLKFKGLCGAPKRLVSNLSFSQEFLQIASAFCLHFFSRQRLEFPLFYIFLSCSAERDEEFIFRKAVQGGTRLWQSAEVWICYNNTKYKLWCIILTTLRGSGNVWRFLLSLACVMFRIK